MIRELEKDRSAAIGILVKKGAMLNVKKDGAETGSALHVHNAECTHCGRPNHTKENCWDNPESDPYRPSCDYGNNQKENRRRNDCGGRGKGRRHLSSSGYNTFPTKSNPLHELLDAEGNWILDSGATGNMSNCEDYLFSLNTLTSKSVSVVNGNQV